MTSTLPRLGEWAEPAVISRGIYRFPGRAGRGKRKFQAECGAAAAPVEYFDRTTMLLNDTVSHREPQTGAFARRLGGKEGIVDAVDVLGSDSAAVIGHV